MRCVVLSSSFWRCTHIFWYRAQSFDCTDSRNSFTCWSLSYFSRALILLYSAISSRSLAR